ncbi:MAG: LysM peptidoglycan-binding domain-containing protein, partial [Vulcanimicrobiaceae bacterium]
MTTPRTDLAVLEATSPLQALYTALQGALSGTTMNLYPGAISSGSGPIASALDLLASAGITLTGATLSPWPSPTITVTGTTSAFAGNPFSLTATFTLDTDQKTVVMTLAMNADQLLFASAPWFTIDNPALSITSKPVSGSLTGTITFTDSSTQPPTKTVADISATLPPDHQAVFATTFTGAAPSIQTIYQYVGGFNLIATLPPPLNVVTALQLNSITFTYDFSAKTLTQFAVDLTTTPATPWNLLGKLSLTTMDIQFAVNGPTGARTVSWKATPQIAIGSGAHPGTIDVTVSAPPFTVAADLDPVSTPPDPTNPLMLADVVSFFLPSSVTPPISGQIDAFAMTSTPGSGVTSTTYKIATSVSGTWSIPSSNPIFTVTSLGFVIDGTEKPVTGSVTGSITFFEKKPALSFGLVVTAAYDGTAWTITGTQQPDTTIHVSDIIENYVGNGWWTSGLPDFSIQDFSATIVTGANANYTVAATVPTFNLPFDVGSLTNVVGSFGNTIPGSGGFASITADARWFGIDLQFALAYKPGSSSYTMKWEDYATLTLTQTPNWVGTLTFTGNETLGGIIETFVGWATGYAYGLAAPWSLLNDISLSGSSIAYDFTAKTVTLTVGVGLNLGFCSIDSVGLTYNTQATGNESSVAFQLNGNFPWVTASNAEDGDSPSQISWDATKPESTKQPPGNGNEYIDLRLLALGQHVSVPNIGSAQTVKQAITDLAAMPSNSDSDPSSSGQQLLPPVVYDAGSNWLIGTDFGLLKLPADDPSGASYAATLQIVFLDPTFYALRIALDGGPAKILGGLDFEIIYRKISDTIGVYQAEITLPTAMRTIQTGIFTIGLPTFAIEVFTNGDFQVDFGFPWNNDFSRSFTLQAIVPPGIPLTGSAGFYFGKLSSATTNKVPAASNGTFNPVIVFGFGIQAGFGKSVSIGPLSASFSVTVLGIIEGVIAKWNPYLPANAGQTSRSQLDGTYYYSLSGTFGVAGILSGSVDFAIVKASVNISIIITAQIVFTSYAPIVLSVSVSVDVSASLEINLGIFSITLHFSFSLDVRETFTIGNPQGSAPWTPVAAAPSGVLSAPLAQRLTVLRRADAPLLASAMAGWNDTPAWNVLVKDSAAPLLPLTAYLTFALTASGDGAASAAQQQVCYVAMLAIDTGTALSTASPVPACIVANDTSFDALAKLVARWTIAAFWQTSATQPNLTCDQLDAQTISDDVLATIEAYLADEDGTNPVPMPTALIETMLAQQVALTLWGPSDIPANASLPAAFFPMPIELALTTPTYGGSTGYGYTFGGYNTLAAGGIGILRAYFDQLAVQTQQESPHAAAVLDQSPTSVADFVFGDYFLLIARQMVAALREGLRDFKYAVRSGNTPQAIVATVNSSTVQFTVSDLFQANGGVTLTTGKPMTIIGATTSVQANQSFSVIAALPSYGGAFTATDLATANLTNTALLRPVQSVTYQATGETVRVSAGDSLTSLAARFTVAPVPTPQQLAADPGIQAQTNLLIPFAAIALPPLPYPVAPGDTPAGIAAKFGVSVASLGAPSAAGVANPNASIADLFAPSNGLLDMPHLTQNTVGALIEEAQRTGATTRLAAMVSRYHLHGLRLPTEQNDVPFITPNALGMWVVDNGGTLTLPPTAGLYALTGQQFPIPPITAAGGTFAITLGGASAPPWLSFKNGTTAITTTISMPPVPTGDIDATPINALRTLVTTPGYRFVSNYTEPGTQGQLVRAPATYALGTFANWITAAPPTLPNGSPAAGAVPRIWTFPTALSALLDQAVPTIEPTFTLETQTYDEASGKTLSATIANYGWASQLSFTIKQVPPVAGATASAQTYEVIGADASDIVLLEDIVAQFT